jgi:hypothetical protein
VAVAKVHEHDLLPELVFVTTKFLEMLLQSPFPYFSSPARNNLFEKYKMKLKNNFVNILDSLKK